MPKNHVPIEDVLEAAAPRELSAAEQEAVWSSVAARITRGPVPSPYVFTFTHIPMIPLVIALAVLLSAGGTVAASDSARPGDLLFPVDRAVEDARFAFASESGKADLRVKFAEERLHEFDSILDDEIGDDELSGTLTEAEADIFTDITIVKIEAGDRKAVFSTSADTRSEIIDAIADRYGFSEAEIDAVLSVETEDRASRADDGGAVSEEAKVRIEHALAILNAFVLEARGSATPGLENAIDAIEEQLERRSGSLPEEIRVKVRDDRSRVEVRGEDGSRVRIETKDGETRIKVDDDEDDDSSDDSDDSNELEIEADIFTDVTIVKVEENDRKSSFETSADTRAEIIDAIADRYGFSEAEIDAALSLETEDRASRADDLEDEDDDSDDDNSGKDDDEDEDDDNSGSGSSGHGGGDD